MLNPFAHRIEQYLDLLSARQRLTASNIANADTPGYKTKDIDFASELNRIAGGAPSVTEVQGLALKNDGNNVSLDREARLLSENAMRFSIAAQFLRGQLQQVRSALQEGRS